jgi:hypothetical protein
VRVFVMCGCVIVWVLYCVSLGNMCICIYCVSIVCTVFCIVSLMYTFPYLLCLYCHRVTTQLLLIIITLSQINPVHATLITS